MPAFIPLLPGKGQAYGNKTAAVMTYHGRDSHRTETGLPRAPQANMIGGYDR